MCRASARGWTVIPGAPASTHIFTASSTEGTLPPRELRTVATLLTFTESFATYIVRHRAPWESGVGSLHSHHQVPLDGVRDLLGPRRDLALVLPLDHDAQQRFGSRVANQQPPLPRQPRLDGGHHTGNLG